MNYYNGVKVKDLNEVTLNKTVQETAGNLQGFLDDLKNKAPGWALSEPTMIDKSKLKIIPLSKTWTNNYLKWELLERIGNEGFFKVVSVTGGKYLWYEALTIVVNPYDGTEFVRQTMNLDRNQVDPVDPHFSFDKMHEAFLTRVGNAEAAIIRKQKEQEADRELLKARQEWEDKVYSLKKLKGKLIYELKQLNRVEDDINSILNNKEVRRISEQLDIIENLLKYSK